MRPVIGITAYAEQARWGVWEAPAALIPLSYVSAIERAGGRPLLVPPSEDGIEETLAVLDGLLFSGGSDVDPNAYGAEPHPETNGVRPERDQAELALLAAGLHGIEQKLELPPPLQGNAYESDADRFPHSLREAIAALEEGAMARAALGDDVVDHYLNYARTEQRLFDEVVTCYERERLFERG